MKRGRQDCDGDSCKDWPSDERRPFRRARRSSLDPEPGVQPGGDQGDQTGDSIVGLIGAGAAAAGQLLYDTATSRHGSLLLTIGGAVLPESWTYVRGSIGVIQGSVRIANGVSNVSQEASRMAQADTVSSTLVEAVRSNAEGVARLASGVMEFMLGVGDLAGVVSSFTVGGSGDVDQPESTESTEYVGRCTPLD